MDSGIQPSLVQMAHSLPHLSVPDLESRPLQERKRGVGQGSLTLHSPGEAEEVALVESSIKYEGVNEFRGGRTK